MIMHDILRFIGHQDWIRYGIRYRIIKFFVPINTVDKEVEVGFFGLKYFGNLKYSIDWSVYFFGAYEKTQLLWVKNLLILNQKTGVALDIGANVGIYSIYAAKVHKNFKVYSFEPSVLNLNILVKNINKKPNGFLFYYMPSPSNGNGSWVT